MVAFKVDKRPVSTTGNVGKGQSHKGLKLPTDKRAVSASGSGKRRPGSGSFTPLPGSGRSRPLPPRPPMTTGGRVDKRPISTSSMSASQRLGGSKAPKPGMPK